MLSQYVLTVSSNDKPGVIEKVSSVVEANGGSWLESRLAHLAGKFVGVVCVGLDESKEDALIAGLKALEQSAGIQICTERAQLADNSDTPIAARFSAIGPDRVGIIKEIASAFARQGINVEELETTLSSMPYSGDPIFEAVGRLSLPSAIDLRDLYDKLDSIANDLGLDLDVDPIESAASH